MTKKTDDKKPTDDTPTEGANGDTPTGDANGGGQAVQAVPEKPKEAPHILQIRVQRGEGARFDTMQDVWRFAEFASRFGMVPSSFKDGDGRWNLGAITVALVKGLELDMKPTQALQSIYVVNQQPALWGDALPGLVLASRKVDDWTEAMEGTPYEDDYAAVVNLKRKGIASTHTERFTVGMAKTAKLWGKTTRKGQPTPWVTSPDRMLTMRARGYAFRMLFADVLKGLGVAEELQDVARFRDDDDTEAVEYATRQEAMLADLTNARNAEAGP